MSLRVMWLLNHTSARKFEIQMLKNIGVKEIFLPKNYPNTPSFRSASVDYSEDQYINMPPDDLELMNQADWYEGVDPIVWDIANKHFDVIFFILYRPNMLEEISRHFKGMVLLRAYGLLQGASYSQIIREYNQDLSVHRLGRRLYFAEAYPHLGDDEGDFLKNRRIYIPLGMHDAESSNIWQGKDEKIYFVCPEINVNPYYSNIYENFIRWFGEFDYVVAGAQPIKSKDPKVLGFVSDAEHAHNMIQSRLMFYHSTEPNHIHYHPFEAIKVGMPLIFMAGGMLDKLGGKALPGRCETLTEAKRKIQGLLRGDAELTKQIRESQTSLLNKMAPKNCEPFWRDGFLRIENDLRQIKEDETERPAKKGSRRLGVILPVAYRGGTLRALLSIANALHLGSRSAKEDTEIVLFHPQDNRTYGEDDFSELKEGISLRPFLWKTLSAEEASRAMHYAGYLNWIPDSASYMVPDDGIRQGGDCDAWLVISDRLILPLLPIKPTSLVVYDYVQRYINLMPIDADNGFIFAARNARRLFVTTKFTYQDVLQYVGASGSKVRKLPALAPDFPIIRKTEQERSSDNAYFIWTTNAAIHKNHFNAAEALRIYYEELGGSLECRVTGVNTDKLLKLELDHLKDVINIFKNSKTLKKKVFWLGDLSDAVYRRMLSSSEFLWHPAQIDNGTFSVVEAACLGTPALSSDYPAMRELDDQFSLSLAWMDCHSPRDMAKKLIMMEHDSLIRRRLLPNENVLKSQSIENLASTYWMEMRECL